ncbi:unnamed protein product, partial [Allacma fusca]
PSRESSPAPTVTTESSEDFTPMPSIIRQDNYTRTIIDPIHDEETRQEEISTRRHYSPITIIPRLSPQHNVPDYQKFNQIPLSQIHEFEQNIHVAPFSDSTEARRNLNSTPVRRYTEEQIKSPIYPRDNPIRDVIRSPTPSIISSAASELQRYFGHSIHSTEVIELNPRMN